MIARCSPKTIEDRILVIRGQHVMLDSDLAELYGVPTRHLNEQVKRNRLRFPSDFMFQLSADEWRSVVQQRDIVAQRGGRRYLPYAFTERGAGMLASVLRGRIAGRVGVEILRAFKRSRPEGGPLDPADGAMRLTRSVFAAIRDAVLSLPEDVEFTTDEPYTYFIQAGNDGPIKIGWTRNLLVRLRTLAVMWPAPLKLLGVIKGNVEAECHARFAAFRLGGEWFMPAPSVCGFIRRNAATPDSPLRSTEGMAGSIGRRR